MELKTSSTPHYSIIISWAGWIFFIIEIWRISISIHGKIFRVRVTNSKRLQKVSRANKLVNWIKSANRKKNITKQICTVRCVALHCIVFVWEKISIQFNHWRSDVMQCLQKLFTMKSKFYSNDRFSSHKGNLCSILCLWQHIVYIALGNILTLFAYQFTFILN